MKESLTHCPVEDVMRVFGGRWRALLIYHLTDGPKRFSDLRRDLPDISQRMLTLDLRELEAAGAVARTVYPEVPPRVEYALTGNGRRLYAALIALSDVWIDMRRQAEEARAA